MPYNLIETEEKTIPRKLQDNNYITLTFDTAFSTDTCWYSHIENQISYVKVDDQTINDFRSSFSISEGSNVKIYFNTQLDDLSFFLSYNEDSGEVVSIERNEVILDSGHTIEKDDVQTLLDEGLRNIVVYDNNPWYYPVSSLITAFPETGEDLSVYSQIVLALLFPKKECSKLTVDEKLLMAYNLMVAFKAACHPGYAKDVLMSFRINPEEQHTKITSEESKLINLISEFYNQKINAIMDCNTDLDVMPLFSTDKEICSQLEVFLTEKGVSEWLINSYVKQLFEILDL
jgi:hypothetical protein